MPRVLVILVSIAVLATACGDDAVGTAADSVSDPDPAPSTTEPPETEISRPFFLPTPLALPLISMLPATRVSSFRLTDPLTVVRSPETSVPVR